MLRRRIISDLAGAICILCRINEKSTLHLFGRCLISQVLVRWLGFNFVKLLYLFALVSLFSGLGFALSY